MSYEKITLYLTIGMAAVLVLVLLTNMITQVIKKIINKEDFPPQALVFLIAEVLTYLTMVIICAIMAAQILWYYWVLAFIVGILVAYGAMFGYDNLYKQIFTAIKSLIDTIFGREAAK